MKVTAKKLLATSIIASLATPVVADFTIEEVVVSARKRSENLQEVPIAVSAFTESTIQSAGIERPADFISLMPNVTIVDSANVGDTQVNIRGIVSTRDAESTFAYVVDGVLATNPNSFNEELLDVRQIEVLKGPQGALYGRNAVSGAILVTTNEPENEFEGKVKVGAGNNGTKSASAVVSGALVDDVLLGRLSISQKETDGHYSNVFRGGQGAVDYLEDTTVRGRLIWNASDDVKVDVRAGHSEVEGGAINFNAVFAIPQFETFFNSSYYADVNGHNFIFANNVPGINEQETNEFSIKTDWDRDGVDVSLVISYSDLEEFLLSDGTSASFYAYDATESCLADRATLNNMPTSFGGAGRSDLFGDYFAPFGVNPATTGEGVYGPYTPTSCDGYQYQERNQTDTSVELRFTSDEDSELRWIAGLYAAEIERDVVVAYGQDTGNGFLLQPYVPADGPNPTDLMFDDTFDTSVMAVFGQVEFDLNETMELAFAGRYDREERDVDNNVPYATGSGNNANSSGFINPAFTADIQSIPSRSATFSQFQPKATFSWAVNDDVNVYASAGVGFRSGGFNSIGSEALIDFWYGETCPFFLPTCGSPGVAVDAQLNVKDEYAKEVSTSYELGAKMEFFDNRLRVNAAVFDTTVEDSQFFEFFAGPFGLMRVVTTIDELNIRGFEADFNAVVTENLSLFGGVGLIDSEIKENVNRPLSVGNEAPQAPDRTYNLGAEFDTEVATGINLVARLDWQYVGETWFHTMQGEESPTVWNVFYGGGNNQNFSKAKRDAYDTLNARVSLSGEQWDVTLWGKNITDEEYLEEVIQAPEFGGSFIHPGARDAYGVDFSYRF